MKRFLLLGALALSATLSVSAQEPNGSHEMCLSATDYAGCVEFNSPKRIGNTCTAGYAYMGDGKCREVECRLKDLHHPLITGKMWKCKNWYLSPMKLSLGVQADTIQDENCPTGEPEAGWNSICNSPYEEPSKKDRVNGTRY